MPVYARLRRSPLAHTLALALTLGTGSALADRKSTRLNSSHT